LYITAAYRYVMPDSPQRYKGRVSQFADDSRTVGLLQRVKETNNDPFTAVNPHRIRDYFLVIPGGASARQQNHAEPKSEASV